MPDTPILLLRFPDGEVEYRTTRAELQIGTLVRSRGALWRVSHHDDGGAALLEPASPEDDARHGPVIAPSPLGDEPTLLETIIEI